LIFFFFPCPSYIPHTMDGSLATPEKELSGWPSSSILFGIQERKDMDQCVCVCIIHLIPMAVAVPDDFPFFLFFFFTPERKRGNCASSYSHFYYYYYFFFFFYVRTYFFSFFFSGTFTTGAGQQPARARQPALIM
jgi:hypothetical protein